MNGQKNTLTVIVENKSDRDVTVLNVAGALLHPDTNAVLQNVRGFVEKLLTLSDLFLNS